MLVFYLATSALSDLATSIGSINNAAVGNHPSILLEHNGRESDGNSIFTIPDIPIKPVESPVEEQNIIIDTLINKTIIW